ncbi:MAG: hypothetical protein WCC38_13755, partial [Pseudonocardiaceae bacterium]
IILAKHLRERAYCVPEALRSFTASRRPIAKAAYQPTPGQRLVTVTAHELDIAPRSGHISAETALRELLRRRE